MKKGAILINTARGGLVVEQDIADACKSGQLGGYGADVLEHEPLKRRHPFKEVDNIIITPHVGSRTFECVERQALRAAINIVNYPQRRAGLHPGEQVLIAGSVTYTGLTRVTQAEHGLTTVIR